MSSARVNKKSWRIPRTGLVAAVVTFLVLGSSVGAYAYWSAQASLTSTAKAGSISITFSGFSSLLNTFVNDTRTVTGSVTVKNTSVTSSTTPIPLSIALGYVAGGSSVLAMNLDVTMWGPTTAASCTSAASPSGTIKAGTWASFPSMTDTLVAQQTKTWCVRTSNDERSKLASSGGAISLQPTATATMTAGSWIATASAATTQNTQYIYPVSPIPATWFRIHLTTDSSRCLDIKASGGAGTELIDWPCHGNPNQQFRLNGADSNGYLAVTPRHAQTLRWDNGGSTVVGSGIKIQPASGPGSQGWQFQQVSSGVYQIVNKTSGLCAAPGATLSTGETAYYQVLCNGTAAQRFTLENAPVALTLACTVTGGSKASQDVNYTWESAFAGSYTFQANNGGWKTIGTSAANASDITIDGTEPTTGTALQDWNDKTTYSLRVLDSNSNVIGNGQIRVEKNQALSCG